MQAGLLSAQVGFDALFFGRADYQVGQGGCAGTRRSWCLAACTRTAAGLCFSCTPLHSTHLGLDCSLLCAGHGVPQGHQGDGAGVARLRLPGGRRHLHRQLCQRWAQGEGVGGSGLRTSRHHLRAACRCRDGSSVSTAGCGPFMPARVIAALVPPYSAPHRPSPLSPCCPCPLLTPQATTARLRALPTSGPPLPSWTTCTWTTTTCRSGAPLALLLFETPALLHVCTIKASTTVGLGSAGACAGQSSSS